MAVSKNKNKGSQIARNSAARLAAVQAVYQMRTNDQDARAVIFEYREHRFGKPVEEQEMVFPDTMLFTNIVSGVADRWDDLASVIDAKMAVQNEGKHNNTIDSLEFLLGSILLCGAYEMLAHHEIDAPVIISDYLDITHAFYEGGEAKLVNAVLDRVKTALRDGES